VLAVTSRRSTSTTQLKELKSFSRNAIAVNEALLLSSLRQHELTEASELLNRQLQAEIVVRQKTEEALAESEKRYVDLYEFAPISYLTINSNALVATINVTGSLLLGAERSEILERPFSDFVTSGDVEQYRRLFGQVIHHGERQTCDLALRRSDGTFFHAQLDCVRINEADLSPGVRVTIVDISQRKQAEAEREVLAFYDALTHLPNRRLLMDRVQQALSSCGRTSRHGAILFIDLDDFKRINDTQGHTVGDLLLQQIAARITACVRESDTVARLGGDEFVVMLQNLSEDPTAAAEQARHAGEKVLASLSQGFLLGCHEHYISGSIGYALFNERRESVEDVLKRADLALYRAKATGRNILCFFDPEMQRVVAERALLDADLRQAIKNKQLVLFYQPQVDAEGRLTGAEGLVRWQHPSRGLLLPEEFIPFAEETGLIESIGHWVLETACAQLAAWSATPATADLSLAVNVSAHEFRRPDFETRLLAAIEQFDADPRKLMLEFTESAMFATIEETLLKMTRLKALGVCFSIDDFGTGYSSLSYLKNMPLDELKIDRSFVRDVLTDPRDAAIVRTIVGLGQSLHLSVIAEGVEMEEQREFLSLHGCRAYQGFLFSRPVPEEDLTLFAKATAMTGPFRGTLSNVNLLRSAVCR